MSPRNNQGTNGLPEHGLAALLLDLLSPAEEADRRSMFDIAPPGTGAWNHVQIDATVAAGETQTASPPKPAPVQVSYFSGKPDDDGHIHFFQDIYKRDKTARFGGIGDDCKDPSNSCRLFESMGGVAEFQ